MLWALARDSFSGRLIHWMGAEREGCSAEVDEDVEEPSGRRFVW
jgi:hypothetical protein